jgi:hypothetical protein
LIERFRKRPIVVETILWDGTPERAEEIRNWIGDGLEGESLFLAPEEMSGVNEHARVWNDQEHCWIPVPLGHRVVKGALGELYPISPAALVETFESAEAA